MAKNILGKKPLWVMNVNKLLPKCISNATLGRMKPSPEEGIQCR